MAAKPIIVGTDSSEASLRAVDWAAREAALHRVALRIMSVPGLPAGMSPYSITHENVAGVVYQAARRMLVLGRHVAGPGVGPVTHAVLSHAHGPIAIVPGENG
jgi:hypothetical protein